MSLLAGKSGSVNTTKNKTIPRKFVYWDDWNPFTITGSSTLPLTIKKISNINVRGSSVFLSTSTGSAAAFSSSTDRSSNTSSKVYSIELPLSIVPYSQGTYTRDKFAVFTNNIANNIDVPTAYWSGSSYPAWHTIGVGPTSTNTNPSTMTDAAKSNGYVYVMQNGQIKDKDYSLKVVFRYTWGRA
jgi:hypothetical protein